MAEHLFRKKPVVVKASQLANGQWIVVDVNGNKSLFDDSDFRATYEPVVDTGVAVVPVPWPGEKRVLRIAHGFPCPACQAPLLLDIRREDVEGGEQKEG